MGILDGKAAVVTGAGRGIGRAVAEELARQGAAVVVNDVDEAPAREAVEAIEKAGGKATVAIGSVATLDSARAIVGTAVERFGRIDLLLNNAGALRDRMFVNMTEEDWDLVIAIHLKGHFCMTKAAVEKMKDQGSGAIVNVTSTAGLKGNPGQANYATAKSGIIGFTKTLALELKRNGIRVNAIAPGAKTRMTMSIPEEVVREKAKTDPKALALLNLPGPEFIGPLVAFLASDDAKEVTGHIFGIRGDQLSYWEPPRQSKILIRYGGWKVESLKECFPRLLD